MLKYELQQRQYQEYIADMQSTLVMLLGKLGGANQEIPSIREIWNPEEVKKDTRTGEQIINDLLEQLKVK